MYRTNELEQFADRVLEFTSRYNSRHHVSYAPMNLSGKYTKYPCYGDFPETYTLRTYGGWWRVTETTYQKPYVSHDVDPLGAEDFITVHFNQAVLPTKLYVYETYSPGSVVRVWGRRARGKWTLLWEGAAERCAPQARKFQPTLRRVSCFVDTIRLEMNCSTLDHHVCLDAVLLTGRPMVESAFQLKCFEAFGLPQIATVTTICDSASDSSSKRNKKKNFVQQLPYEVMVHIFQFLDLRSLLRCACVCKQWNAITSDSLLYQNISLKKYWHTIDGEALDFILKRCKNLKKLDLSWCGNDDSSFPRKIWQIMTNIGQNLTHLSLGNAAYINGSHLVALNRCPELVELRLRNVYISDLDLFHGESLVGLTKLITLDLYSTNITNSWLIPLLKVNPDLKHLNLDFCEDIESMDDVIETVVQYNKNLTGWSSWKARNLSSRGVSLLSHCRNMQDLDLGWGMSVSPPEHALELIAIGCKDLRRLILSGWRSLVDAMLVPIVENCKKLEQLDLLSIRGISKEFVQRILNELPNLQLLELSFCDSIPMEKIELWRISYPHVKIQRCYETD